MKINIHDNYQQVIERIAKSAISADRKPNDIRLVVVTKTQPIDVIKAVLDAGATNLGENYVEEAIPKIEGLTKIEYLKWHMVGHVQSRKASSVCKYFQYLHSLDSLKLAERLSINAVEMNKKFPVMLEVNVGGEASKSGWDISIDENWNRMLPDVNKIISLPGLNLLGVMTIPPYSTNPEDSRPYYRKLRKFKDFISNQFKMSGFNDLSMGMSSDYEVAIQEGSTWVRIGQAILGPRSR
jgi:pyridoxal phosphate enzyme (YggS family)